MLSVELLKSVLIQSVYPTVNTSENHSQATDVGRLARHFKRLHSEHFKSYQQDLVDLGPFYNNMKDFSY